MTPALELEFEVYCAECGEGLCNNCEEGRTKKRGYPYISVKPCDKCIESATGKGYDNGYKEGVSDTEEAA